MTGAPSSTVIVRRTPPTQADVTTWTVTIVPALLGRCRGTMASLMHSERCWSHHTTRDTNDPSLVTTGTYTLCRQRFIQCVRRAAFIVACAVESCWRRPNSSWRSVAGMGLVTIGSSLDARRATRLVPASCRRSPNRTHPTGRTRQACHVRRPSHWPLGVADEVRQTEECNRFLELRQYLSLLSRRAFNVFKVNCHRPGLRVR